MSAASRRYVILVTALLAIVAAGVAGVVLTRSGSASGVDLTSANLVPANAAIYVAINTDLTSSQWLSGFRLVQQLGQNNPNSKLKSSASDGGVNWDAEVAPFLGG